MTSQKTLAGSGTQLGKGTKSNLIFILIIKKKHVDPKVGYSENILMQCHFSISLLRSFLHAP